MRRERNYCLFAFSVIISPILANCQKAIDVAGVASTIEAHNSATSKIEIPYL